MSYMKRVMDEHGICEAYIESQETALNTAKDKTRELEKLIEELVDLVEIDHYRCALYNDYECVLMDYGDWQIKYQHGLILKAKQVIEESESQ